MGSKHAGSGVVRVGQDAKSPASQLSAILMAVQSYRLVHTLHIKDR